MWNKIEQADCWRQGWNFEIVQSQRFEDARSGREQRKDIALMPSQRASLPRTFRVILKWNGSKNNVKEEPLSVKATHGPEEQLPTKEEARAAFASALTLRQDRIRSGLNKLAASPPQVLILEGGSVEERFSVALWHAARLNCMREDGERPCLECSSCLQIGAQSFHDLYVLDGREGSIKIETIRELRSILGEPPRGEGKRVVLLAEAQSLGVEAANALLKSLEEPRPGVCFLLLAPQRERLLPTLVSRGWVLTLAWPESSVSSSEVLPWEEALARFISTGQGWFERTSGKGAVDAVLARKIVLSVQKAQIAVLAGKDNGPLGTFLGGLQDTDRLSLNDLLSQCQESIEYMVNPALVLDWLATRLHVLCRRKRLASQSARIR